MQPAIYNPREAQYESWIRDKVQQPAEPERLDSVPHDIAPAPKGSRDVVLPGAYFDGVGAIDWGRDVARVVEGSQLTVAGSTVAVALTLTDPLPVRPPNHLSGAFGVIVIRQLAIGSATAGAIARVVYQAPNGSQYGLGIVPPGSALNLADLQILTGPLAATGPLVDVGRLYLTVPAAGVPATMLYQLSLGVAYLRPAKIISEVED